MAKLRIHKKLNRRYTAKQLARRKDKIYWRSVEKAEHNA
jgi:hypothetical protein